MLSIDSPEPLGKYVVAIRHHDANMYHNVITGRSVTEVLNFVIKTPVEWYSKNQATVETTTYGS